MAFATKHLLPLVTSSLILLKTLFISYRMKKLHEHKALGLSFFHRNMHIDHSTMSGENLTKFFRVRFASNTSDKHRELMFNPFQIKQLLSLRPLSLSPWFFNMVVNKCWIFSNELIKSYRESIIKYNTKTYLNPLNSLCKIMNLWTWSIGRCYDITQPNYLIFL